MITLKAGDKVRFKLRDGTLGARAVIESNLKSWDAKIPGYAGEGFWFIRTVPDQRGLIAHEDDLSPGWEDK